MTLAARFGFDPVVRGWSDTVPAVFFTATLGRATSAARFGFDVVVRGWSDTVPTVFFTATLGRATSAARFGFDVAVRGWSDTVLAVFFAGGSGCTALAGRAGFATATRGCMRRAGWLAVEGRLLAAFGACPLTTVRVGAIFFRGFIASHRSLNSREPAGAKVEKDIPP